MIPQKMQIKPGDMRTTDTPHIRTAEIPRVECTLLCSSLLREVEKFYRNPANFQAFEKWKREREGGGGKH